MHKHEESDADLTFPSPCIMVYRPSLRTKNFV